MFSVYTLQRERTGKLYIGSTENLERRLAEHNLNLSTATKHRRPWRLMHSGVYASRKEAMARERYLKTGHGRAELQGIVSSKASRIGRGRLGDTLNQ